MNRLEYLKKNLTILLLLLVTATLMTVTGIIFKQNPIVILPLYISLFVALLQTRANRYSLLVGGFNSIIYTAVYIYLGIYATAVSSFFFSCIVQLATFVMWSKRKYANSTKFRKMSAKWRIIVSAVSFAAFLAVCLALDKAGSVYQVLDSISSVFGALIPILTLFAFIEYSWLMIPSGIISILLNLSIMLNNPAHITYVIFSIYSMICVTRGFFSVRRLYEEQQEQRALETNNEQSMV